MPQEASVAAGKTFAGRNGAHIGETSNRLAKDGVATPRGRKKANFRPAL